MRVEEFKAQIVESCGSASQPGESKPVADICARLAQGIGRSHDESKEMYRVLRELVHERRHGDLRGHAVLVAVHDTLLRNNAFSTGESDPADLCLFDEDYYLTAYPDIANAIRQGAFESGFQHFVRHGALEGRTPCPEDAMWAGGSRDPARSFDGSPDQRWRRRLDVEQGQQDDDIKGFGVNLIGFHSGNLGFGVTARHYHRLFMDAGLDVCPIEIPVGDGRAGHDQSYADSWAALHAPAPHPVNIFVMTPGEVTRCLGAGHNAVQFDGKINVLLPFWELPRLPRDWIPIINTMDVVIAASGFVKYAFMMDIDGPCIRDLGHPIYLPDGVTVDRVGWEIPEDAVAFVSSFEMASDINRKNPFAGIEAFEKAFGDDDKALLIVKVNNPRAVPEFEPHLRRLKEVAERRQNIRILDRVLSYGDVMSLFASCDVFVSLHRAEGLGLCLMEAMTLGRPVIATGWSGNMAFTNERNSCLVGYDLVPVRNATQVAYAADNVGDARWAEASIDDAVYWMRRLAAEPQLRKRIGARAAADMVAYQQQLDVTEIVATVRNVASRRGIRVD